MLLRNNDAVDRYEDDAEASQEVDWFPVHSSNNHVTNLILLSKIGNYVADTIE
jgi:hypothetical protein